jgi:tRNA A37 methylthiotransferase MiaB
LHHKPTIIIHIYQNCVLQGIKEITLLGQNVNSYCDKSEEVHYGGLSNNEALTGESKKSAMLSKGFKTIYKPQTGGKRFSHLLDHVSQIDPDIRIRFTSPHPKDFPDEVIYSTF